ncbi:MAG: HD domain-containing protein [Spirochaetes bacterium]|jgi:putative hydrolase of HD superfamily|nr:HD domain-containing protein [Spirochaetota bacterium]
MDIDSLRTTILNDAALVLSETERLQYAYALKREIRYNLARAEERTTESVAEHVYGMHVLGRYFHQLESAAEPLSYDRIQSLITWHDVDEAETGDIVSWRKTDTDRERERTASAVVLDRIPALIRGDVASLLEEYEAQATREARFVKALDKIEPLFECCNENGVRVTFESGQSLASHERVKYPYLTDFPYMRRFCDVITAEMIRRGAFSS